MALSQSSGNTKKVTLTTCKSLFYPLERRMEKYHWVHVFIPEHREIFYSDIATGTNVTHHT